MGTWMQEGISDVRMHACVRVCHSMEEVTLAAAASVASVQRHLTTCIYHSLIEREG